MRRAGGGAPMEGDRTSRRTAQAAGAGRRRGGFQRVSRLVRRGDPRRCPSLPHGSPQFLWAAARKRHGRPQRWKKMRRAILIHGVINHGQQMLREQYRRMPVTYFCPQSGIGRAIKALSSSPRRLGILGLGCGTLAAYGRAGDSHSDLRNQPAGDPDRRVVVHLLEGHAREAGVGLGRRPPGSGIRAQPAVRSAGDGCVFRRLRARPPDHPRSVPHLFPSLEARRHRGRQRLEFVFEPGAGDGQRRRGIRQDRLALRFHSGR